MTRQVLDIPDAAAMEALGAALARDAPVGLRIYLVGDLGAGKTTLVRGFLRGLGYRGGVRSPTYTLVEPYEFPDGSTGRTVYHLDLYRLGDPEELEWIGIRDLLDARSMMLVEWPERGHGVLPPADLELGIAYQGSGRRVRLIGHSDAGRRLVYQLAGGEN
ncbi:MAG: tRNA (adenosine(37)-N6)-threonylcarbamoyltransferase complex ATPase subunit type 1 TsaE [Gammaproteobacteria bacterium]